MLLLLLLCLLPRAFMAWKIGGLCNDAPVYIQVAESFDRGLLHEDKYNRFALNLYPVVLMLLHRSGLDWELAGKLWNVAISCLTVLPLYGWVRRQFDDRVALAAGCLYALHSELIRWSPEGVRDPTFWFCMVLSLYLFWRAVTEVRLSFFLMGGLALALAVMTRSEGLFLVVPLLLWSFHSKITPQKVLAPRRKLLVGVMLAVGVFPALLVLASLFWFRGHAPWELVRTKPLEFIEHWIHACLAARDQASSVASGMSWTTRAGRFAFAMLKGLTPVFALFACLGAAGWWRSWRRREHRATAYTVLLFLLAIWIHLSIAEETSSRYFVPVVLMLSPLAALGLLACSQQLSRFTVGWVEHGNPWSMVRYANRSEIAVNVFGGFDSVRNPPFFQRFASRALPFMKNPGWSLAAARWVAWTPALLFIAFSLGNVVLCDYRQRGAQAELGRWTGNEFGRGTRYSGSPALLGPTGVTQVVAHYAGGHYKLFDLHDDDRVVEGYLRQGSFDMVLLLDNHETAHGHSELLRHAAGLGYGPLDGMPFSNRLRNMVVLVRRNSIAKN